MTTYKTKKRAFKLQTDEVVFLYLNEESSIACPICGYLGNNQSPHPYFIDPDTFSEETPYIFASHLNCPSCLNTWGIDDQTQNGENQKVKWEDLRNNWIKNQNSILTLNQQLKHIHQELKVFSVET